MRIHFLYTPTFGSKVIVKPIYQSGLFFCTWDNRSHHVIGNWVDLSCFAAKQGKYFRGEATDFLCAIAAACGGVAFDDKGTVGAYIHRDKFVTVWPLLCEFSDRFDHALKHEWLTDFLIAGGQLRGIVQLWAEQENFKPELAPSDSEFDAYKWPKPAVDEEQAVFRWKEEGWFFAGRKIAPADWEMRESIGAPSEDPRQAKAPSHNPMATSAEIE